jgi:hypothetical protein
LKNNHSETATGIVENTSAYHVALIGLISATYSVGAKPAFDGAVFAYGLHSRPGSLKTDIFLNTFILIFRRFARSERMVTKFEFARGNHWAFCGNVCAPGVRIGGSCLLDRFWKPISAWRVSNEKTIVFYGESVLCDDH